MAGSSLLTAKENEALLGILQTRFENNRRRHAALAWDDVRRRLKDAPGKLWSLSEMEKSGGEPDVIDFDEATGAYIFCDCSPESPSGRRNLCYDGRALQERKTNKPQNSATDLAASMGITLLSEAQYRALQLLGDFDTKTSSWLETPAEIRALGGAIFGDKRYAHTFVYHNGATSYYAVRGFRGRLTV